MHPIRSGSSWTTFKIISTTVYIIMPISIIRGRDISSGSSYWTATDNTLNYQQRYLLRTVIDKNIISSVSQEEPLLIFFSVCFWLPTYRSPISLSLRCPPPLPSRPVPTPSRSTAQSPPLPLSSPPAALLPSPAPALCRHLSHLPPLLCSSLAHLHRLGPTSLHIRIVYS
jgi:hypothetical protein